MEILDKFKQLVDKHYIDEHHISFYENELNVQPKYLSKLSKKLAVIPPCQILLQKQISHCEELLKNTDKTIKEIAYEMNFEDPYYFSRLFKRKTGVSPSKYRKQNQ